MEIVEIKNKRQSNGLWGTPMNITGYSVSLGNKTYYEEQLISAIIIFMANSHNSNISIKEYKYLNFLLEFTIYDTDDTHKINIDYRRFGLYENKLVVFTEKSDETKFNRFLKLKHIVK